jgi:uncharacterized protein
MRILFFALLALLVYLVWRTSRAGKRPPQPPADGEATPQPMLRCAHCATHVPATDAVQGRLGAYCSTQHRDQKEG